MRFKLKNYRLFKDTDWIEFSPITIFIGANGTGKSSLIQPFLLLGQTVQNSHSDVSLITNGYYVKAGNYVDIVNNHDVKKNIEISLDFDVNCDTCDHNCLEDKNLTSVSQSKPGDIPPSIYTLKYGSDDQHLPELKSITLYDCLKRELLKRNKLSNGKYNLKFIKEFNNENDFIKKILLNHTPKNFLLDDSEVIKEILSSDNPNIKQMTSKGKLQLSEELKTYLGIISYIEKKMIQLFQSIKYIGPIRDIPKRIYDYNKESFDEVGRNGEYTTNILFQNRNDIKKKTKLLKWLELFRFAQDYNLEQIEKHPELYTFDLKPIDSDIYINFSDACFGLSQLLPILVQSIYSEKNDIIITEQPELHLNPYLETVLADFLAEMVKDKKRFIIETHSEHFFLRLRTHIKKGLISSKDVSIYFTETKNGVGQIRKIDIDENGNFPNNDWPNGFFEQSLQENLLFATTKKGL